MSQESWELPVIVNQSLKLKFLSVSNHFALTSPPPPLKKRHKSKDLFACLHKVPYRNVFQQSNHISRQINALSNLTNTFSSTPHKKQQKRRKKSKIFITPIPITKPLTLMITAYHELEMLIKPYYSPNSSDYLMEETLQLKELVRHGITFLKDSLQQFKHRDQVFLDPLISLLFHTASSEVTMIQEPAQAIYHLARAEYYALKCNLLQFAAYCLSQKALIYREMAELQLGLQALRKGVVISVHSGEQEVQHALLQKMGLFYYYSGNTALGGYYHRMAENGLTNSEAESFRKEFKIQRYLIVLKSELFGVRKTPVSEALKIGLESQKQSHLIQMEEMERQHSEHKSMLSKMLKDGGLRKIGQRLQKHIEQTTSLASIIPHSHSPSPPQKNKILPQINVSHVLKSHLSRNRTQGPIGRDWQLFRLMDVISSLPQ